MQDFAPAAALTPIKSTQAISPIPAPSMTIPVVAASEEPDHPAARYPSGLPIGVQLVASPGGESQLVALAAQLESLNPWPRSAPQPPSAKRDEPDH